MLNFNHLTDLFMKGFVLTSLVYLSACSSTDSYFARFKMGYKVQETHIYWNEGDRMHVPHPIACSIDVGRYIGPWSVGVSHDSQCFEGYPFNNNLEYSKTEIFAAYEYRF